MAGGDATLLLTELPEDVFYHIFSHLPYEEIARNRQVCRKFDELGSLSLNRGFVRVRKYREMLKIQSSRLLESAASKKRPYDPDTLFHLRCVQLLVEISESNLFMTFCTSTKSKVCRCSIPGKVIDELFHIYPSLYVKIDLIDLLDNFTSCRRYLDYNSTRLNILTIRAIDHINEISPWSHY